MAASNLDKLMEVGIATATTLDANYTINDTSITVASTSGWPTATGVAFAIDVVDSNGVQVPGTYNEYVGVVSSATSITSVDHVNGTDRNYSAGATTRVYIPVSAERENRIVEWGVVQHKQDGTHADTITTDTINENTPANGVTIDGLNIKDSAITTANSIPNTALQGGITADKLATGAITLGYAQITSNSTTTSGTFAVGSNTLGVSVTIPSGARRVRVTVYSVLLAASSTNTPAGAIFSGATVGALTNQLQQWNGGSSTSNQGMNMQWVSNVAPSAGTVAYTFAMLIGGGHTATLTAGAGFPAYILVEAI